MAPLRRYVLVVGEGVLRAAVLEGPRGTQGGRAAWRHGMAQRREVLDGEAAGEARAKGAH